MEQIAIIAATLVAKWAAESVVKEAGKSAWGGLQRVYEAVKAKLTPGTEGAAVLERLEETPSEQRTAELAEVLDKFAKSDKSFAQELRRVVDEAERDAATASFITEVRDNAKVGKITNIGSAGIVNF